LNSLRFLLVLGLMGGLGGCSLLFVAKGETRFVASRWKGEPTTVSLETQMSQPVDDCIPRTNDEEVIQYTVRQGDNLWKLSRRFYGNSRHVRSLEKDNGLGPHHAFKVGLVIKITAPTRNRENGKPVETPVPNLTQAISTPFSLADMVPLTQVPRPQVNLAFAPGEKLKFEVRVLSVLGGYATLEVGNPVNVEGRPCLPLIARANSAFPFSTFYNVNDIQTSYFDAVDFLTWKFENNVLEGNYKAHNVELYHQLQHQLVRQHNDDISVSSSIPALSLNLISLGLCNLLMGFSLFWIIQFHLSGAVLLPLIGLSFYFQWKASPSRFFKSSPWFLAGSAISGAFLLPTYIKYGISQGSGQTGTLLQWHLDNIKSFFTILARFLSFASFEIPRFVGANTAERWAIFQSHLWLLPLGLFLLLAGWLQVLFLIAQWFLKKDPEKDWQAVRRLILGLILLIYISFWFTSKTPAAHTYYLFLPPVMLYSFYCWNDWMKKDRWRKWAKIFLVCGLFYQAGLALVRLPIHSLYKDRSIPVSAIVQKNYHLLGEKFSDSW